MNVLKIGTELSRRNGAGNIFYPQLNLFFKLALPDWINDFVLV